MLKRVFLKKKYILFSLAMIGLLFLGAQYHSEADELITEEESQLTTIQDNDAVQKAKEVLEENLRCANEKDVAGYIKTLVPKARKQTAKEMTLFFEEYSIEHTLQSFKLLKLEENHMLVETKIKSLNTAPNRQEYRNHIAKANHTFIYQDGQWLIEQTMMIDTHFI